MAESKKNPVVFVGAGPGDPDLITVAGRRALEEADLVVYAGSLVSRSMLSWTRPGTETVDSAGLNLEQIVDCLVEGHQRGLNVVRLHTGDPSLYGAISEQFRALAARGVEYRVIPGVTAAFAAAAALGIEYTLPEISQTLILTRISGRTPVPEKENLASLAEHRASLAVYLSAGRAAETTEALGPAYGFQAPVAVVYRAGWPDQKIIMTTLENLARDLAASGIDRQALFLIGPALEAQLSEDQSPPSRLYDRTFSHGFRRGEEE